MQEYVVGVTQGLVLSKALDVECLCVQSDYQD